MMRARCSRAFGPTLGKDVVGDFIALDAEGVLDHLRREMTVVQLIACLRRLAIRVLLEVAWSYFSELSRGPISNSRPGRGAGACS